MAASPHQNPFARQLAHLLARLSPEQQADEALMQALQRLVNYIMAQLQQGVIAAPLKALTPEISQQALMQLPVVGQAGEYKPIILDHEHAYLYRYFDYEQRFLGALQHLKQHLSYPSVNRAVLHEYFPDARQSSTPINWQKVAAALALQQRFVVISGGPGTGKTTTITRILALLIQQRGIPPQQIRLAAPTGKAAVRMQESIQQARQSLPLPEAEQRLIPDQAVTLHRLLGYRPNRVDFRFNRHQPLPLQVLIVDEASMIDLALFTRLLEALPPEAQLILLGDKDQLASVETGSVFRDLCAGAQNRFSTVVTEQLQNVLQQVLPIQPAPDTKSMHALQDHIVILEHSYRFDVNSGIGRLAQGIKQAQWQPFQQCLRRIEQGVYEDVQWLKEAESLPGHFFLQAWQAYLQALLQSDCSVEACFTAFNQFRVLTALRKGKRGTEGLNQRLEQLVQQYLRKNNVMSNNKEEWLGRPLMITQNDYRQQLFNGDIGLTLPNEQGQLRVYFPLPEGGYRAIAPVRLPAHEPAWAMTVHKSQGSEFTHVLLLLPDQVDTPLLNRELFYTGVTRAKHRLSLLASERVLQVALQCSQPASSQISKKIAGAEEK